ncbi:MAG: acyl-CoA dehydrogenase family protein [Alphaproteobacteria bacterium]|nr:acyl-CoA dehydrogenase family protein [Alphaproteobacteria bacterium SS10]
MDFTPTPEQQDLFDRTRDFVVEKIIPFERDERWGQHGPSDDLRREMNALAKQAGLFAPHVSKKFGGLGLNHRGQALVFEAAGYSPLGPTALNCMAPDEGNMAMMEKIATSEQQANYLKPLAAGEQRSIFCMTEPGGAGADPGLLQTTAVPDGNEWVINGRKWFITGADGAEIGIVMAMVPEGVADAHGATMFLFDPADPAFRVERIMDTIDRSFTGGHGEVVFDNLRVGPEAILGELGEGFRYAQVRLAPARLTHCMRWLGAAQRCHDIACDYAAQRSAFGQKLAEHGGLSSQIADNELDLHQARLMVWHTAWILDQDRKGRHESSMAKVAVSEALYRVTDRSVQILGGTGVSDDTVVASIFQDIRAFRIYDGPSEVHRWAIAKRVMKSRLAAASDKTANKN